MTLPLCILTIGCLREHAYKGLLNAAHDVGNGGTSENCHHLAVREWKWTLATTPVLTLLVFASVYILAVMWSEHLASLSAPFWLPDSVLLCAMLVTPRRHCWLLILTAWSIRLGLSAALGTSGGWFFLYAIANDSAKALLAAWCKACASTNRTVRGSHHLLNSS